MTTARTLTPGGEVLRQALAAATRWLGLNAPAIDALNVYPVPDGDTGTNMLLTMRSAVAAADACPDPTASAVAAALAHGALMGARGNSGVILSQICRGLAEGVEGEARLDGPSLARGFRFATDRAYRAVGDPKEGTILTVARRAAEAAEAAAAATATATAQQVLAAALEAAGEALRHTPEQLPVLREAGVVDAGGQGLVILLEGALAALEGRSLGAAHTSLGQIDAGWLRASQHGDDTGHEAWGYCTQFVITAPGLDLDAIRSTLSDGASSVLVVGDDQAVHIHLHTLDPGAVLSSGVAFGSLHNIKVDNMSDQNAALVAASAQPPIAADQPPPAAIALPVVAVVAGDGLARLFTSLGVSRIVRGGQTMNPSLQQLADAAEAVTGDTVVLLPNNPNVQLVCQHVGEVIAKRVIVVPTHTIPQGIAALLAVGLDDTVDQQAAAMLAALDSVRSIEVTTATRSITIDGVVVEEGQSIALLDQKLVAATASPLAALQRALDAAHMAPGALLTVYYGDTISQEQAETAAAALRARPGAPEVDAVRGGQPHYPYIVSIEG